MTEVDALDIARQAVFVLVKVSAPPLLAGLIIGLIISLFQALTQIQEMTLTFVPKVLIVFASLIIFAPFMLAELSQFTRTMFDRMVSG
jgi:flagellar biosynthetic protein FliQ